MALDLYININVHVDQCISYGAVNVTFNKNINCSERKQCQFCLDLI